MGLNSKLFEILSSVSITLRESIRISRINEIWVNREELFHRRLPGGENRNGIVCLLVLRSNRTITLICRSNHPLFETQFEHRLGRGGGQGYGTLRSRFKYLTDTTTGDSQRIRSVPLHHRQRCSRCFRNTGISDSTSTTNKTEYRHRHRGNKRGHSHAFSHHQIILSTARPSTTLPTGHTSNKSFFALA